ncbi:MAG: GTPase [Bacillota bacterium]
MPANLTPQYYEAEETYKKAVTPEEKIAALEEMLAVIPKHKGTEKIQADLKKRLSRLKEEGKKKARVARFDPFNVEKQGAGQVALYGYPNTGKSALVAALTRAKPKVADYPFTTTVPQAGMMPYKDILIQMVDTPPASPDGLPPGLAGTLYNADALLLVIDIGSGECLDQLEGAFSILRERRILREDATPRSRGITPDRFLVLANKADLPGSVENLEIIKELGPPGLSLFRVSAETGLNLELLKERTFLMLDIIRVYSKIPGKEPDMSAPFVLSRGSTVLDMAETVHKDIARNLKSARLWGSAKFEGQTVQRDYVLADGDIVELNT